MKIIRRSSLLLEPASHEDPNNPGVLKQVVARRNDVVAGAVQMINWAVLPAGKSFQPHYHEDMEEIFILTTGSAEVHVGDETETLAAGDTLVVPPGIIHMMENRTDGVVEYIVVGITQGKGGKTIVVSGDPQKAP